MEKLSFQAKFSDIGSHGQIETPFYAKDFKDIFIEYEDTVKVTFLGKTIIVPYVPRYSCTHSGGTVLMDMGGRANIALLSFHANFVKRNRIAVFLENEDREIDIMLCHGIEFPIEFTFELDKKHGYHEQFLIYNLKRTNNREDYSELNDEQFCNFRNVAVGSMKPNILYRTSTPIDKSLGRNKYADECLKKYGIKTIINLCDNEEKAKSYDGYNDTYYSKQNIIFLNSNADITSYNFGKSVLKAMRFILSHEGPYAIHCMEGQDRTGAICAIFGALLGASKNQLIEDFMQTYENFYHVEKGSVQYNTILKGEMQKDIASIRGFSYDTLDILKNPESFLLYLDLFENELRDFKALMRGEKI